MFSQLAQVQNGQSSILAKIAKVELNGRLILPMLPRSNSTATRFGESYKVQIGWSCNLGNAATLELGGCPIRPTSPSLNLANVTTPDSHNFSTHKSSHYLINLW